MLLVRFLARLAWAARAALTCPMHRTHYLQPPYTREMSDITYKHTVHAHHGQQGPDCIQMLHTRNCHATRQDCAPEQQPAGSQPLWRAPCTARGTPFAAECIFAPPSPAAQKPISKHARHVCCPTAWRAVYLQEPLRPVCSTRSGTRSSPAPQQLQSALQCVPGSQLPWHAQLPRIPLLPAWRCLSFPKSDT